MPYDMYEAEDGTVGGGAAVVGPNRTIGDLAGEASGRKAVTLNTTGAYVQWTTRASTNTLVTRFSIPDSAGGGGTNATLDVYVNGTFLKAIDLTSKYAWLYGDETGPGNSPERRRPAPHLRRGARRARPDRPRRQHDQAAEGRGRTARQYAIDFINPSRSRRSPTRTRPRTSSRPASPSRTCRTRWTRSGGHHRQAAGRLPARRAVPDRQQVPGLRQGRQGGRRRPVVHPVPRADHAGEHRRRLLRRTPPRTGRRSPASRCFGNYTSRIDGPGKVFDLTDVSNMTIDNIWIEHMVVRDLGHPHRPA